MKPRAPANKRHYPFEPAAALALVQDARIGGRGSELEERHFSIECLAGVSKGHRAHGIIGPFLEVPKAA